MSGPLIVGSHGYIKTTVKGLVRSATPGYKHIVRIDLDKYMRDYNIEHFGQLPVEIDILRVGYWTVDGKYDAPIPEDQIRK